MGLKLIDNWHRAHRMLSVQLVALDGAVRLGWDQVPSDLKAAIPAAVVTAVAYLLVALPIIGRLIDQGTTTDTSGAPKP
jgi:hypothetical protein